MIRVIPNEINCICGRRIQYNIEDIQHRKERYEMYNGEDEYYDIYYITCPICHKEIRLK